MAVITVAERAAIQQRLMAMGSANLALIFGDATGEDAAWTLNQPPVAATVHLMSRLAEDTTVTIAVCDALVQMFPSHPGNQVLTNIANRLRAQQTSLPGTHASRIPFTPSAADQLDAHDLVGAALFGALSARYPAQAALIDSVRRAWAGAMGDEGELAKAPEADVVTVTPADLATHEKIMGERPTFLDVAYLAKGYETARAVVKLRMRFADRWYSGTGFLIAPDRLLTAHHNLVDQDSGEPALEVTAQFDYERAIDGPEAEGSTVPCKLDSIRGEAADDWAVIDLAEPRPDGPLARLSDTPARAEDRVAIIQHPGGMAKQVALHNNLVTFANEARIQYLTDTLPGSSGSPVSDGKWKVVALHHAGGELALPGTKQLVYRNQGISIARVRARMAALGVSA